MNAEDVRMCGVDPGVGESGLWGLESTISIVIWQNVSELKKISLDMIIPILALQIFITM